MFRRMIQAIAVAATLCTLLSGCTVTVSTAETPSSQYSRYYNREKGYSISFPQDWEQRVAPNYVMGVSPKPSPDADFRPNVNVQVDQFHQPKSLDISVKSLNDKFRLTQDSYQVIDQSPFVLAGLPGEKIVAKFKSAQRRIEATVYVVPKDNFVYTIFGTAEESQFPTCSSIFDQIAQSFRFEQSR